MPAGIMIDIIRSEIIRSMHHLSTWLAQNLRVLIDIGCVFDRAAYDELRQAFDISPTNLVVMIFAEVCEPTSFKIVSDQFHARVQINQNAQVRHLNLFVDPGRHSVHWVHVLYADVSPGEPALEPAIRRTTTAATPVAATPERRPAASTVTPATTAATPVAATPAAATPETTPAAATPETRPGAAPVKVTGMKLRGRTVPKSSALRHLRNWWPAGRPPCAA